MPDGFELKFKIELDKLYKAKAVFICIFYMGKVSIIIIKCVYNMFQVKGLF